MACQLRNYFNRNCFIITDKNIFTFSGMIDTGRSLILCIRNKKLVVNISCLPSGMVMKFVAPKNEIFRYFQIPNPPSILY